MTMEDDDASVLVTTLILISLLIGLTWMTGCATDELQQLATQCDAGHQSACIAYKAALERGPEVQEPPLVATMPFRPPTVYGPATMDSYRAPYRLQPFAPSYIATPMGNSTIYRAIP